MPKSEGWSFSPVSRHSLILVVAGLSFVAMGWSFKFYIPGGPRWEALIVARNVMSLDAWANVFIVGGISVMCVAHWAAKALVWGYAILTGLSVAWAMFYFAGCWFTSEPLSNISTGFVWGLQAFVWWAISGFPDISSRKVRMPLWTGSQRSD